MIFLHRILLTSPKYEDFFFHLYLQEVPTLEMYEEHPEEEELNMTSGSIWQHKKMQELYIW